MAVKQYKMSHYLLVLKDYLAAVSDKGARCSSVVRAFAHGSWLMVRWIVGLILHGGPIELFLIPASTPQLALYVLSCLWDVAYKRFLAANQKE